MFIKTSNDYVYHSIAILIPVALMWILYHNVLQAWWLGDDPFLLQSIAEHGIISHFYQSEVWRSLSPINLTPWVILSLGIDWHFFGLEPLGYYWHHLFSFTFVLIIAYLVLNLFFSPLVCSLTLSIFVASIPSADIAQFLMVRHYLEGFGLTLLAFLIYVKTIHTQKLRWAILGSFFYLLATTAKEIYIPLVVILPFLPIGTLQQRWKMLIPFIVVAGTYVIWRIYMLKPNYILSSYGDLIPKLNWDNVLSLPKRVADILGWQYTWQLLIILLACLVFLWFFFKNRHNIFIILLWIMITILPIIPVLSVLGPRYLFLPYFVFCLSIAFSLQYLINQQKHYIALTLGLILLLLGVKSVETGNAMIRQTDKLKQYHLEGKFILTTHDNALLINPVAHIWYHQSLQWLKEQVLNLPKGVNICYDLCICKPKSTNNIYQYVQGELRRTSILSEYIQSCGQSDVDLSVKIHYVNGALHWQFTPYKQGEYYVTLSQQKNMLTGQWMLLPSQGNYPYKLSKKLYWIIKYISPEGWHTYSPILTLDPAKKDVQGNVELIWER